MSERDIEKYIDDKANERIEQVLNKSGIKNLEKLIDELKLSVNEVKTSVKDSHRTNDIEHKEIYQRINTLTLKMNKESMQGETRFKSIELDINRNELEIELLKRLTWWEMLVNNLAMALKKKGNYITIALVGIIFNTQTIKGWIIGLVEFIMQLIK